MIDPRDHHPLFFVVNEDVALVAAACLQEKAANHSVMQAFYGEQYENNSYGYYLGYAEEHQQASARASLAARRLMGVE